MSRTSRALGCVLLLVLLEGVMVYFLVSLASTTLTSVVTSTKTYTHLSQYERISKPEIQQSLLIVSDMTSHFGREVAFKLAEMGFFVLAGVRTESDRKAYTGYNTVKGLESFVLDIVEPMDMVQMSYRVSQIEQKYNRSLSGLIIVDTYQTNDDIIPVSEWKKQKTLKKKLMAASQNDTELMSMQDRDALFHMNTHQKFDIYNMHSTYQHVFQGPYRLIQMCYELAAAVQSNRFRVSYLRPALIAQTTRAHIFSDDIISHSRAFLEARESDETSLLSAPPHASLSLVEYAHMKPPHRLEALSPSHRKRNKDKDNDKPFSKKSKQDKDKNKNKEGFSTTATPSPIATDQITRAIIHSLVAIEPKERYRLGALKLNVSLLGPKCADSTECCTCFGDEDDSSSSCLDTNGNVNEGGDMSCPSVDAEESENKSSLLMTIRRAVSSVLLTGEVRKGIQEVACQALSLAWDGCWSVYIGDERRAGKGAEITIPLAVIDNLLSVLPPSWAEWAWRKVVLSALVDVV